MDTDKLGKFILGVRWDGKRSSWYAYVAKPDGTVLKGIDDCHELSLALAWLSSTIEQAL